SCSDLVGGWLASAGGWLASAEFGACAPSASDWVMVLLHRGRGVGAYPIAPRSYGGFTRPVLLRSLARSHAASSAGACTLLLALNARIAAAALMDASGTSDRTPRTPGQFRRSLSAAPRTGS